jgi:hypothetical protein
MITSVVIGQTARDYGWTSSREGGGTAFRKGRRRVYVEFSVRGGVSWATTESGLIQGTGKRERVLAELTR